MWSGKNRSGDMKISFSPMDEPAARKIMHWQYNPPYDLYNLIESEETIHYALDPELNYYVMRDSNGGLIGFCSFGEDGQVPGGDYSLNALDIGMGIRPDLIGQGQGKRFVNAVLNFAHHQFQTETFRVTIAAFNQPARKVWMKNGFKPSQVFVNQQTNREFIVMVKIPTPGSNHDPT
jgi:RimJ/RimL family protein N-acetyltransferase